MTDSKKPKNSRLLGRRTYRRGEFVSSAHLNRPRSRRTRKRKAPRRQRAVDLGRGADVPRPLVFRAAYSAIESGSISDPPRGA